MGQCVIMTSGYAGDSSDDCTAMKSHVLEGYKAITKDSGDDAELGTMPNKGTWTNRIGVNGKAIIPAGYHNGSGYVDQAITNRGAWGTSIGVNGNITIPEGYHNGQGHVTQSIATMGGQSITPSANQQTVACSSKYMTGNIVVNSYVKSYTWTFNANFTAQNVNSIPDHIILGNVEAKDSDTLLIQVYKGTTSFNGIPAFTCLKLNASNNASESLFLEDKYKIGVYLTPLRNKEVKITYAYCLRDSSSYLGNKLFTVEVKVLSGLDYGL